MKTPSAPKAPDPVATANAQTNSNIQTGVANTVMGNANERGPYGNITYNQIGTTTVDGRQIPRFERVTDLSQNQQAILDQNEQFAIGSGRLANAQVGRLDSVLGTPLDANSLQTPQASGVVNGPRLNQMGAGPQYSSVGQGRGAADVGTYDRAGAQDWSADRQRVVEALNSRLQPQQERDRSAMDAKLANQGIMPGSEAYREAVALQGRQENDMRMQAELAGSQEQSRLAGLDFQRTGINNAATSQQFADEMAARGFDNNLGFQTAGFNNDVAARQYSDANNRVAFNNDVAQRGFTNEMDRRNFQNATRSGQLAEAIQLRNQPINETTALMSGSQVTTPTGQQYRPGTIAGTDVAGITQQGFQNQWQNYQQKLQSQNAMMGGLFGLGGALLAAPMTGGGSLGGLMGGRLLGG